ncbi:MAG: acyl transferase [Marinilabiliales bacterium]|nr:MAG: acyl transferase [Marinilabiliales bacterium]
MDKTVFNIAHDSEFREKALEVFWFQSENCAPYRNWIEYLGVERNEINDLEQIPFLPVEFYQNKEVYCADTKAEIVFETSGTTGAIAGRHYVADLSLYETSFMGAIRYFYPLIEEYCVLALLPAYLERKGSSLIYMVNHLIELTKNRGSGFFLYNHEELASVLKSNESKKQKTLLLGVSFALLDFIEKYSFPLKHTLVMETGGMKGRRKEELRSEVHKKIKQAFNIQSVHSEYGMTELLSQAYSKGDGVFYTPPWMKILIRDIYDPKNIAGTEKQGGINIIDLANFNSCSFIATKDIGKLYPDGGFEVAGRFDHSDIRGCNLMVQD